MLELFIIGIIGVLFHIGYQLDKATRKEDFTTKSFIRKNVFNWLVSIAIVSLALYAKEYFEKVFEVTKLTIPFIGFFGADIFAKLQSLYKNRIKKILPGQ